MMDAFKNVFKSSAEKKEAKAAKEAAKIAAKQAASDAEEKAKAKSRADESIMDEALTEKNVFVESEQVEEKKQQLLEIEKQAHDDVINFAKTDVYRAETNEPWSNVAVKRIRNDFPPGVDTRKIPDRYMFLPPKTVNNQENYGIRASLRGEKDLSQVLRQVESSIAKRQRQLIGPIQGDEVDAAELEKNYATMDGHDQLDNKEAIIVDKAEKIENSLKRKELPDTKADSNKTKEKKSPIEKVSPSGDEKSKDPEKKVVVMTHSPHSAATQLKQLKKEAKQTAAKTVISTDNKIKGKLHASSSKDQSEGKNVSGKQVGSSSSAEIAKATDGKVKIETAKKVETKTADKAKKEATVEKASRTAKATVETLSKSVKSPTETPIKASKVMSDKNSKPAALSSVDKPKTSGSVETPKKIISPTGRVEVKKKETGASKTASTPAITTPRPPSADSKAEKKAANLEKKLKDQVTSQGTKTSTTATSNLKSTPAVKAVLSSESKTSKPKSPAKTKSPTEATIVNGTSTPAKTTSSRTVVSSASSTSHRSTTVTKKSPPAAGGVSKSEGKSSVTEVKRQTSVSSTSKIEVIKNGGKSESVTKSVTRSTSSASSNKSGNHGNDAVGSTSVPKGNGSVAEKVGGVLQRPSTFVKELKIAGRNNGTTSNVVKTTAKPAKAVASK